jgi:hypothetical protein
MNEQLIKELLVKAGVYDCEPNDPDFKFSDVGEEYLKFAELIVRECASVARNTDLEDVEGGDSAVLAAARDQILEHFGS